VTGEYAGYFSKIFYIEGLVFIIVSLKVAFNVSMSSPDGCAGAGNVGWPNIINTGTGPFTFTGTTNIILMPTLIKG